MNAQNFEKEWQEVDNLMSQQLPKSAYEKANAIFEKSLQIQNQEQIVKSIFYLQNLSSQLEEIEYDSRAQKEINYIEANLSKVTGGARSLLISFLAEKYSQYLDRHYWQMQNRTAIAHGDPSDISKWSISDVERKVQALYLQSCEDIFTKEIDIQEYKNLIANSESKYVRNLYDFLHRRAIQALSNERHYLQEPEGKFILKKEQVVDLEQFALITLESKDTTSNKYQVLRLYQKLIREHIVDSDPTILIDIELQRLDFIYNHLKADTKNRIYRTLLNKLYEKYKAHSESYYALISLAQNLQSEAHRYQETQDSAYQWRLKEAVTIYDRIAANCKDDNIVKQAKNLRNDIVQNIQSSLEIEKVYLPNRPILVKLSYTNIDKIYYRIYRKDMDFHTQKYYQNQQDYFEKILKEKPVQTGSFVLKNPGDYQQHSTELDIPNLSLGSYVMISSHKENYSLGENYMNAIPFQVSNLSYIVYEDHSQDSQEIFVLDRMTGNPIAGARVEVYSQYWENEQKTKLVFQNTTDESGNLRFGIGKNQNTNFKFIFKKGEDKLYENQGHHFYYDGYQNQEHSSLTHQIFLDREIYRPGQTIYFKGIVYTQSNKSTPKIAANEKIEVEFKDANWQNIGKMNLVSNEYGTYSGSFVAPSSGLLGVMHLHVNQNYSKPLRIEEYKRPTFEVVMDTFRQVAKLGDTIHISGKGQAYSGASLPNAKLKYRVQRQTRYPFWKCWWMPMPREDYQLAYGELTTDDNGKFQIDFPAEAGEESPWDRNPVFLYQVHIEMTDITGETQMGKTTVAIGKVDFQIKADVKSNYRSSDRLDIPIHIENIQGNTIQKNYQVRIEKLQDPKVLYQQRYWKLPDMQVLSREDFLSKFPNTPYRSEDQLENFSVLNTVYSHSESENKTLSLDIKNWASGAYKMTISSDDVSNKSIEIVRYFSIEGLQNPSINKAVVVSNAKTSYEPNEKLDIRLTASQRGQKVWYQLLQNQKENLWKWSNAPVQEITNSVVESDRGGMSLRWMSVWNNRIYQGTEYIAVPWTNKELDIEYITFRDKLEPNADETWQIKIKGKKGVKVMAEVLANMYDKSLDIFAPNSYSFFPYTNFSDYSALVTNTFSYQHPLYNLLTLSRAPYLAIDPKEYPYLQGVPEYYANHFGGGVMRRSMAKSLAANEGAAMMDAAAPTGMVAEAVQTASPVKFKGGRDQSVSYTEKNTAEQTPTSANKIEENSQPIKVRSNLKETVFFYPNLMTDAEGNVIVKFKMNEALTQWKFMALATSKDLQIGYSEKTIVTQKQLMIQPNSPRFLREHDEVVFTARVTNLSNKTAKGYALLELHDAISFKSVNEQFGLPMSQVFYEIAPNMTQAVEWKLHVPEAISALNYRIIAKADNLLDGEENTIPILTDRMLVTETMPFHLKANTTKQLVFEEMNKKISLPTLQSKLFKLEYTANPVWYAIQSLPYLMEYPYECTEQVFNRYFANALSSHIVVKFPKIKSVFESWKGTDAMKSNLSKNQSLKSALLEETPWVLEAQSEEEQRRNIATLFDIHRLAKEEESAIQKLYERQNSDGSYSWFPGGYVNPYMTQYVMEGLGHLSYLGVKDYESNEKVQQIFQRGLTFIDQYIVKHYEEMAENVKRYGGKLEDDHLDAYAIHYLYTRSFFEEKIPVNTERVVRYYRGQAEKYWTRKSLYEEGMLALYFHRTDNSKMTSTMMKSFRERAKVNEEKGMYWDMESSYWWYQLPIETHSMMTEVFESISDNQTEKDNLKLWLLKNKQTNRWETTKATASAIYALLGSNNDRLDIPQMPMIKVGQQAISFTKNEAEQGTGYIQKVWIDTAIRPSMANIEVSNPNSNIAWGAIYWQYLESLNAIQSSKSTPLKVDKKIYIVRNTGQKEVMEEATASNIQIGDKLRIRLTLMVDREMEYLHLKDMRAAGLEPRDALSGYRWSGGLGYYQTTRDASMNFFIDHISKGTYTIEYDLYTNLKGRYSNGITTFQSMYAPEFSSHSAGQEVIVK